MTLIQPHAEKNLFIIAIFALFGVLFTGVIWLIFLYNQSVNFRHSALDTKSEIQKIQVDSVAMRDTLFSYLDGRGAEQFAESHGLVPEKNPHYLRASNDTQWVFASRF